MTPRQELKTGLACLALCAAVFGIVFFKRASWSIDGIEAVVVLVPTGIYFVLKGGLGYDVIADVKRLAGRGGGRKQRAEDEDG